MSLSQLSAVPRRCRVHRPVLCRPETNRASRLGRDSRRRGGVAPVTPVAASGPSTRPGARRAAPAAGQSRCAVEILLAGRYAPASTASARTGSQAPDGRNEEPPGVQAPEAVGPSPRERAGHDPVPGCGRSGRHRTGRPAAGRPHRTWHRRRFTPAPYRRTGRMRAPRRGPAGRGTICCGFAGPDRPRRVKKLL